MSYDDISIKQYYRIHDALLEAENELDLMLSIMQIIYGEDYATKPIEEYYEKLKELEFLKHDIPFKKVGKHVTIGTRKYRIRYDIADVPAEVVFSGFKALNDDINKNIHFAMFMALEGKYGDDVKLADCLEMDMVTAQSIIKKMNDIEDAKIAKNADRNIRDNMAELMALDLPFKEKWKIFKGLLKTYRVFVKMKGAK